MARKKLVRGLPPLALKLKISPAEHKEARLLDLLRRMALRNQSEKTRTFYSMRDIARHFAVPLSMVARVYRELERDGILVGVRGSKTLLQGRTSGRSLSIRSFVGLPAMTRSFVTLQDYRTFFIRTRRELRARGFAVATIFYDPADAKAGRLTARIRKYNVDTLFWADPDRAAKETIAQLDDTGLAIVGIRDREFPAIRCRYEIQRENAIRTILQEWRVDRGVRFVRVIRAGHGSAAKVELIRCVLEDEGLECVFESAPERGLEQFLNSLVKDGHGIIFPSRAASLFAFRVPNAFAQLMNRMPVALTGGPPSIPFASIPDVPADLVIVDWQMVAERLATDLINRQAFEPAATTIFEAKAHCRVLLSRYAQTL